MQMSCELETQLVRTPWTFESIHVAVEIGIKYLTKRLTSKCLYILEVSLTLILEDLYSSGIADVFNFNCAVVQHDLTELEILH